MSKNAPVLALTLLSLLLPFGQLQAAVVYRSDEGWTVEGEDTSVAGSAAEQMKAAEKMEADGNDSGAFRAYKALVKKYGQSFLAPKAQRKVGLLLEKHGDNDKAYDAFTYYLTKYPQGEDFDAIVEEMFKIAKSFLEGEKRRLFGVRVAPSMVRAQAMFEGIVKNAPFSKLAPLAQFNVGQALEKQADYPKAIEAYQAVYTKYPTDAIAADALYQVGYVLAKEAHEGSYDPDTNRKAHEAFEDFIARYPNSEKVAQARENMGGLETGTNKNVLEIAKFYDKIKKPKAALLYYNDVIKSAPGSPDADYAKNRIQVLKQVYGEENLHSGPEKTETGERAQERRKLQAKVNTVSRPDYVGPPVVEPPKPKDNSNIQTGPPKPKLRTSTDNLGPVPSVEPPLPGAQPASPAPSNPSAQPSQPNQ